MNETQTQGKRAPGGTSEADCSQCAFRQQLDHSFLTGCGLSVSRYIDTDRPCPKCGRRPMVVANKGISGEA